MVKIKGIEGYPQDTLVHLCYEQAFAEGQKVLLEYMDLPSPRPDFTQYMMQRLAESEKKFVLNFVEGRP